jgi:hypothetical protein
MPVNIECRTLKMLGKTERSTSEVRPSGTDLLSDNPWRYVKYYGSGQTDPLPILGGVACAIFRFAELVACCKVFLIARRTVCHVFPPVVAFERAEFGGSPGKVREAICIQTTFAVRVRIRSENRLLDLVLDAIPLLFWRFTHGKNQNIMTRLQSSVPVFSVV